ncbi:hypothetical protein H5410_001735 [Solanum commersonii]|uniref:Uncharacterized protein n=1 Tax=Solanum commersonii TaxID=4109 RepID=A0A9J6B0E6_SOLCO|nr:hypothetical protein H5410_001735 [Solanum commersonii]
MVRTEEEQVPIISLCKNSLGQGEDETEDYEEVTPGGVKSSSNPSMVSTPISKKTSLRKFVIDNDICNNADFTTASNNSIIQLIDPEVQMDEYKEANLGCQETSVYHHLTRIQVLTIKFVPTPHINSSLSCQISQNSSSSSLLPSSTVVVSPTSSTPSTRLNIGVSLPTLSSIRSTTAPACSKTQDV